MKVRSQSELRAGWATFLAQPQKMVWVDLGTGTRVQVNSACAFIWQYFGLILTNAGYFMQNKICFGYANRQNVNDPSKKSLHAYGIAVDINSVYNGNKRRTGDTRFSQQASQTERQKDVLAGKADTDFTQPIIESITKLKTPNGFRVFSWGGAFTHFLDPMHFELACLPEDMAMMSTIFAPSVQAPSVLRSRALA